jgi:ActR/RegA family two-component response regulator
MHRYQSALAYRTILVYQRQWGDSLFSQPILLNQALYRKPIKHLKKVSGRLRELLRGKSSSTPNEPVPARLLVVDDEESICFSISDYFARRGFKVDTAREVEEAERLIAKTTYKVIIQDLRLGVASHHGGMDVIRFVHEHTPETRVVVLTAYGTPEVEDEAFRSGADVFLRKPKPLSQVAQVVQGLIETPRQRAARQH